VPPALPRRRSCGSAQWTDAVDIYVGVVKPTRQLSQVVWRNVDTEEWGQARVLELNWQASASLRTGPGAKPSER
jgi:hypothetical protein